MSLGLITKGREIENYIPPATLETAVRSVHKAAARLHATGPFDHALHYLKAGSNAVFTEVDKVKVARIVAQHPVDLTILDLGSRMREVIAFIAQAND